MKKFYPSLAALLVASSALAQQPANGTMDNWSDTTPWTSDGNTKTQGQSPASWTISHVIGINGMGATVVGTKVDGREGGDAANLANSMLATQTVPGYMTLGTTWSTSVMGSQNDGGSFGGVQFTNRPDALAFWYKLYRGIGDAESEPATVVAYLWKGTWTQAAVPANIVFFGSPATVDMVNRDKNILGKATDKGGAVSKTDDAELIASIDATMTQPQGDWTRAIFDFTYASDAQPEMMNIILSAGDYWGGATAIKQGNSITVDDIAFLYYSRLKSATFGDKKVEITDGQYDYTVDAPMTDAAPVYELLGRSASYTESVDGSKLTVVVKNADGVDADGLSEHTYTFTFSNEPAFEGTTTTHDGYLTVDMGTGDISGNAPATIQITTTSADKCNFLLPNLSLGELGTIGDIAVDGLSYTTDAAGTTTYTGSVEGMKLLGGGITANDDVNGTITAAGVCDFAITVLWVDMNMPIAVTFKSEKAGIISIEADAAPAEYYTLQGIRVASPTPGAFYIVRQGSTAKKIRF